MQRMRPVGTPTGPYGPPPTCLLMVHAGDGDGARGGGRGAHHCHRRPVGRLHMQGAWCAATRQERAEPAGQGAEEQMSRGWLVGLYGAWLGPPGVRQEWCAGWVSGCPAGPQPQARSTLPDLMAAGGDVAGAPLHRSQQGPWDVALWRLPRGGKRADQGAPSGRTQPAAGNGICSIRHAQHPAAARH